MLCMEEDDEIVEKVNKANTQFYRAFENLSIEMMDNLWKHDENIVCIHPGWDLFTGWLAIRESWITIFANTGMIKFTITNTKIRTFDKVAVVVCLENIETTSANGRVIKIDVIATNIFEQSEQPTNQWLLIHHHGSPVTNYYIPPNVSSQ